MSDPVLPSRPRGRRGRRRHRLVGRVPPGPRGLERRRAARARPPHVRHHVARRRADGHVRFDVGDVDRDARSTRAPCTATSRPRPAWPPASSRSGSSRSRATPIGSRSTGGSPRSTATAASTCTRSRPPRSQPCSRSPAPTTSSPASTSPRTGRRTRSTSRCRSPRARACRAPRSSRACRSPGFLHERGAVTGVRTPYGDIECEYVVNCAGMWARQLGAGAGVNIPLQAAEHYYLITEQIPGPQRLVPRARRPGVVRLLPRRGRRPARRVVRAGLRAVERRRRARRLLVRRDRARLRAHGAVRREGDGARSDHDRDRA